MKLYTVETLDVWGNDKDGYEVNQAFNTDVLVTIRKDDDASIVRALKRLGYAPRAAHLSSFEVDGDEDLYVSYRGKPLVNLILSGRHTPVSTLAEKVLKLQGIDFRSSLTRETARLVNAVFLARDESDLWPVQSTYNATKRAIKRLQRTYSGTDYSALEYIHALDAEISRVVNQG